MGANTSVGALSACLCVNRLFTRSPLILSNRTRISETVPLNQRSCPFPQYIINGSQENHNVINPSRCGKILPFSQGQMFPSRWGNFSTLNKMLQNPSLPPPHIHTKLCTEMFYFSDCSECRFISLIALSAEERAASRSNASSL